MVLEKRDFELKIFASGSFLFLRRFRVAVVDCELMELKLPLLLSLILLF